MPLTPTEDKLLKTLTEKMVLSAEEQALRDVLLEKSREAGIFITPGVDQSHEHAKAFTKKVTEGVVTEYLLLGLKKDGSFEIAFSNNKPPSYALTQLVEQIAILYKSRLQALLEKALP